MHIDVYRRSYNASKAKALSIPFLKGGFLFKKLIFIREI